MGVGDPGFDAYAYGQGGRRPRPRVRFNAISEGWGLFTDRPATWLLAGAVVVVGNWAVHAAVASTFGGKFQLGGQGFRLQVPPAGGVLDAVLSAVVNGFFLGGMFRMAGLQIRGRPFAASDLFGVSDVLAELALGAALLGLAVAVAALFCVVPAFVVAGVLMFTLPLIVDGRLRAFDAVAQSWHALKGRMLSATLFHFVVSLISGLGGCLCCVGLLFTMPLYCLSVTVLYRDFFLGKWPADPAKPYGPDPDWY
jgi:hypothetical protein